MERNAHRSLSSPPRPSQNSGFALVVTLSLMVLLLVIGLGLLSLSSVTMRTSSLDEARAAARANARLAMTLALSELQKEMGPDQRITATSANFSDSAVTFPHWTAALDSWIAGPVTGENVSVNPNNPRPFPSILESPSSIMSCP